MGALAHTDRQAPGWLGETRPNRLERAPARRRRPTQRRETNWNVLAREIVPFPPPAELSKSHPGHRAARRSELARTARAVPEGSAPSRLAGGSNVRVDDELTSRRAAVDTVDATPALCGAVDRASSTRSRQAAFWSRGLRRLLPGAATLAVLLSVWFGAGALSTLRHPALTVPVAAVKIPGGYLYVARTGDTLWSIASELQPGGDPRPLVAEFEQQLHGAELVAGDRLILP